MRTITDATGGVTRDSDYYPFGTERWMSGIGYDSHMFAGMERDSETDKYHTLFRQQAPNLARWLSPDPLGGDVTNPQSLNRYLYVMNNPMGFIDPVGLDNVKVFYPAGGDACESFPWECGGGGGGYNTNPADPCAYINTGGGAECQQAPGLWPNGDPIFSSGVSVDFGFGGGGGGPLSGDFGPMHMPGPAAPGLPCDFGVCGGVSGGLGFQSATDTLTWGGIIGVTTWACGLNPAACVAAGLAGADVALLGYDLYQGYHLAQAYGHFLPKAAAKPQAASIAKPSDPCSEALGQCLSNPWQPAWNIPTYGKRKDCGACYRECRGAGGVWPGYKCPR